MTLVVSSQSKFYHSEDGGIMFLWNENRKRCQNRRHYNLNFHGDRVFQENSHDRWQQVVLRCCNEASLRCHPNATKLLLHILLSEPYPGSISWKCSLAVKWLDRKWDCTDIYNWLLAKLRKCQLSIPLMLVAYLLIKLPGNKTTYKRLKYRGGVMFAYIIKEKIWTEIGGMSERITATA